MMTDTARPVQFQARLEDKIEHNDKYIQYRFELQSPHELAFQAGQYVSIKVSAQGDRRSYSICSSPDIAHGFELLVDITPNGLGCQYLQSLHFGDVIEGLGPLGRFVVVDDAAPAVNLVATGSGIAPFFSIIQDQLRVQSQTRPLTLYWGMRYPHHLFWLDEFRELEQAFSHFQLHLVTSQPTADWTLCSGRVTDCLSYHSDINWAGSFYLCGNEHMAQDVTTLLVAKGVTPDRIHQEVFGST